MNEFKDLRYQVLKILQIFALLAASFATFSNMLNKRPIQIIIQPIIAMIVILVLWHIEKRKPKIKYFTKLTFMIFFNVIYLPIAWIYSPGISSAIGYYAILTIVISVFFVERPIEFILPIFSIIFSVLMMRYELLHPEFFEAFPDRVTKLNDVTLNFLTVTLLLFGMITYINRHYVKEKEQFYKQSITDELTGIYNRRYLLNRLEALMMPDGFEGEFSLCFIDVNNFKAINDTYGHHIGDEVLIEIGKLLQKHFDICGRFGGDEFLGVLFEKDHKKISMLSSQIEGEFQTYTHRRNFDNLSLSIGVTTSDHKSAEAMIKEADSYMYAHKHYNKNS